MTGFIGAMLPLSLGALFAVLPWVTLLAAVVALGFVGAIIARAVHGDTVRWTAGLMISGVVLACAGIGPHIV